MVLGISKDTVAAQKKFADAQEVKYRLLADADAAVIESYGVGGLGGLAKRKSFIVDSKGKIAKVYDDVSPAKHPAEVNEALASVS